MDRLLGFTKYSHYHMAIGIFIIQTMISVKWQTFINLHNSISNLHDLTEKSRTAICFPSQQYKSKVFTKQTLSDVI